MDLVTFSILFLVAFAVIGIVVRRVVGDLSRWDELAREFQAPTQRPECETFTRIPGVAGKVSFRAYRAKGLSVGMSREGLLIIPEDAKRPDLLVPWERIRSVRKQSLGEHTTARVEVDHHIPLYVFLSGRALDRFAEYVPTDSRRPVFE